jgi:hypothetical protein
MYKQLLNLSEIFFRNQGKTLHYLDNHEWKMEVVFGEVTISLGAIKVVWNLCYIYNLFYSTFLANVPPETPFINLNKRPDVVQFLNDRRNEIKCFFKSIKEGSPLKTIDDSIHMENQKFVEKNNFWISNKTASYALLFLLLHEYSHTIYEKNNVDDGSLVSTKSATIAEEEWCDYNAYQLYRLNYLDKLQDGELLCAKIGCQVALLVLNAISIDLKNFGKKHPKSYKRVVDILSNVDKDDDDFWCMLAGIFIFEQHNIGIFEKHDKVYDDFKELTYELVTRFEEFDKKYIDNCSNQG